MNITFLIGNGYDVNMGMKTKYSQFYPYFIENASKDNMIRRMIIEDEGEPELWADLERRLGQKTCDVKVNELEKFIYDKAELINLLSDYLDIQEKKIIDNLDEYKEEFKRSICSFYKGLQPEYKETVIRLLNKHMNNSRRYNFVIYNYTHIIDSMAEMYPDKIIGKHHAVNRSIVNDSLSDILHIHGTTDESMILGVDNTSQLENEELVHNNRFRQVMIKTELNSESGYPRTKTAKGIIQNSNIIVIYGMSLGETDQQWWSEIITWLSKDAERVLIICKYTEDTRLLTISPERRITSNNDVINHFSKYASEKIPDEVLQGIQKRIFVTYDPKLFMFNSHDKSIGDS